MPTQETQPKGVSFASIINENTTITTSKKLNVNDQRAVPKESCWACYKLVPKTDVVSFCGKNFCTTFCKDKFSKENMI